MSFFWPAYVILCSTYLADSERAEHDREKRREEGLKIHLAVFYEDGTDF